MHYLITGHTGFKGSWLSLVLHSQGHKISGISLDPPNKSLFRQADLHDLFENDLRVDIRDRVNLQSAINLIDPNIVVHLAAQPLVREGFRHPVATFETNAIGTLNVLEATRNLSNLAAVLIITTDKVYSNQNSKKPHLESDSLGGLDPYSASKAAADLMTQSWMASFGSVPIAIARAGNVIGGGDWGHERLIPDLVQAFSTDDQVHLRFPNAIRPWQHVLDCLYGYVQLIQHQLSTGATGAWNFGPKENDLHSVQNLFSNFSTVWGLPEKTWEVVANNTLDEADFLALNSDKARIQLDWKELLSFKKSIEWTVDWYKNLSEDNARQLTLNQIRNYQQLLEEKI
jgi:CDP-glucose 4,6-dehydratase